MTIMVEIQHYLKTSSKVLVQLVGMQQEESQRRQQELSEDIALKEEAETIDQQCHVLREMQGARRLLVGVETVGRFYPDNDGDVDAVIKTIDGDAG